MAEIRYKGIRFRSVLTARWAALCDILGIEYLHEPQSFRVGNTVHAPSFFLPSLGDDMQTLTPDGLFLDIQFSPPTDAELQTALAISRHTNRNVCIFHGASMTVGLEWWPIVLETPRPCFLSQCSFCGRYGVSSTSMEDGQPEGRGSVFLHSCMEEHRIPERYDVLSYCSQDLRISAHSPTLDIGYETARALQFTEGDVDLQVAVSRRAVQAVIQQERKAAYNQAKEEAMYLTQLSLAGANSFDAALHFGAPYLHGGFVYSPDEIKLALLRVARLEEARAGFNRAA